MDVETKIREDMKLLGCTSEKKITLAYHLYLHLIDDKLLYDTEYCFNKDVDTLYVVGRRSKNEKLNIYVPITTSDNLSMDFITKMQENLCTVETGPVINFAIIDGDFTIVMYSFTKGLVARQSAENISRLRTKEERRIFINNELKKNRNEILNDALNGGLVDDDDCQVLD